MTLVDSIKGAGPRMKALPRAATSPRLAAVMVLCCVAGIDSAGGLGSTADAATVVLKDGRVMHGWLVQSDERLVVLRGAAESEPLMTWSRDQVELVLDNVDRGRLDKLSPADPQAYLEYAEELWAKREDPEARQTARQLFACAAHLDGPALGRSAMLGLAELCATRQERQACLAMAYLLDPLHDARLLQALDDQGEDRQGRSELSRALARLCLGRAKDMNRLLQGKAQVHWAQLLGRATTRDELRRITEQCCDACEAGVSKCPWCDGKSELPGDMQCVRCAASPGRGRCWQCQGRSRALTEEQLRSLIAAQLRLRLGEPSSSLSSGWGEAWRNTSDELVAPLTLEAISQVDPQACLHRDGQWRRPPSTGDERD